MTDDLKDYQGTEADDPRERARKVIDAGIPNRRGRAVGATVVTRTEEGVQVQHCPAGDIAFEDGVQEIFLDPGETVVIRHGARTNG